jgi:hypothetical protein
MVDVQPEWLAEQQSKIRRAISDLEKYCEDLPDEKKHTINETIERLKETLHGDERHSGKWT